MITLLRVLILMSLSVLVLGQIVFWWRYYTGVLLDRTLEGSRTENWRAWMAAFFVHFALPFLALATFVIIHEIAVSGAEGIAFLIASVATIPFIVIQAILIKYWLVGVGEDEEDEALS